jgi:uncharacterized membrane protein YfcA
MESFAIIAVIYFITGACTGIMSGLIGTGGGIIIVPMLAFLFQKQGFNSSVIMHMAVATSLAIMIVTTFAALLAHLRRHISFWKVYKLLSPGIILGTILGVILANFLRSSVLEFLFGVFLLIMSIRMFLGTSSNKQQTLPGRYEMSGMGLLMGMVSGLLGVGGATLGVPFLIRSNVEMRSAILVSIAVSLTIAIIGSLSVVVVGEFVAGLPAHTIGYIYYPAWFFVALGSASFSALGADLSHRLSVPVLKKVFAVLLLVLGIHMLW